MKALTNELEHFADDLGGLDGQAAPYSPYSRRDSAFNDMMPQSQEDMQAMQSLERSFCVRASVMSQADLHADRGGSRAGSIAGLLYQEGRQTLARGLSVVNYEYLNNIVDEDPDEEEDDDDNFSAAGFENLSKRKNQQKMLI